MSRLSSQSKSRSLSRAVIERDRDVHEPNDRRRPSTPRAARLRARPRLRGSSRLCRWFSPSPGRPGPFCVLASYSAGAADAPDHVADVVGHQQRAALVDRHADRPAAAPRRRRRGSRSARRSAARSACRRRTARRRPCSRSAACGSTSRAGRRTCRPLANGAAERCALRRGQAERRDVRAERVVGLDRLRRPGRAAAAATRSSTCWP